MDTNKSLIDEIKRLQQQVESLNNENIILKNRLGNMMYDYDTLAMQHNNLLDKLYPESNKLAFPPEKL